MSAPKQGAAEAYWKENLQLMVALLVVWFMCSFGAGILFVDALDSIHIAGFPLGFWFAQQGSILIFLALICVYAWRMNQLDRKYDFHEE